jgi:hypothetical protein
MYRWPIEAREAALSEPQAKPRAMGSLRVLVDRFVVTPEDRERDGVRIERYGRAGRDPASGERLAICVG